MFCFLGSGFAKSTFIRLFAKSGGICFRSFEVCRIEAITASVRSGCRGHNNNSRMDNRPGRERRSNLARNKHPRRRHLPRQHRPRSTDAHRHSRSYTTVDAPTVNAATVNPTPSDTSAICGGVS